MKNYFIIICIQSSKQKAIWKLPRASYCIPMLGILIWKEIPLKHTHENVVILEQDLNLFIQAGNIFSRF